MKGTVVLPDDDGWRQGPIFVNDILSDSRKGFLTFHEFKELFPLTNIGWLKYRGIVNAIPQDWKNMLFNLSCSEQGEKVKLIKLDALLNSSKPTQYAYNIILECGYDTKNVQGYADKWAKWTNNVMYLDTSLFFKCVTRIYKTTYITKLRDFQYRLMIGKIFTNYMLSKWKVVETDICNLCNTDVQTVPHLFLTCPSVQLLWKKIQCFFLKSDDELCWNADSCLSNSIHPSPKHLANFLALMVKQYIFACKCKNDRPNVRMFQELIVQYYKIEEYNTKLDPKGCRHLVRKWAVASVFLKNYGIILPKWEAKECPSVDT